MELKYVVVSRLNTLQKFKSHLYGIEIYLGYYKASSIRV